MYRERARENIIIIMKTMYVYILKCSEDPYYTGVTNNLEQRFEQHCQGINTNCYTFTRRPLKIVFLEIFNSPLSAIAFEKKIKKWSKRKKEALVNQITTYCLKCPKRNLLKNDFSFLNLKRTFSIHFSEKEKHSN
jgi:putative endonuclease